MRITLAVCTNRGIRPKTAQCLLELVANSKHDFHILVAENGYTIAENRNFCVVQAQKNKSDYLLFIDDDMTLNGEIPERPGIHPGFKFRYRPAIALRSYEWREGDKTTPAKTLEADIKLLKDQLVDWTIPEQLTPENLKRLPIVDIRDMCLIVTRFMGIEQADSEKNSSSGSA